MLRLATVFSGIGSIEHALERLRIPYQCVFACDNGNVGPQPKKSIYFIHEIVNQIESIKERTQRFCSVGTDPSVIEDLSIHIQRIENMLRELTDLNLIIGRSQIDEPLKDSIRTYAGKLKLNFDYENRIEEQILVLYYLKDKKAAKELNVKLEALFKNKEAKAAISLLKELEDQLNMALEKLFTQEALNKLNEMDSLSEQKQYVDSLYSANAKSNYVKKSYMENYDIREEDFHWDVKFLNGHHYRGQVDLFVGGSPCQSFSMVGKRRGLEDTRGTLFYEYARLVSEIQPKVFIYENVRAILSNDEGRTWEVMTQVFDDLNYTWKHEVLNAKDYGVPQNRERVFVVGIRKDLTLQREFKFPAKIPLAKTMKDDLLDNVSGKYYLNTKGVDFVTADKNLTKRYTQIDGDIQLCQKANQQFNWHGDFVFVEENKDMLKTMEDLEKYFLSEKVRKYVLASGTKNFYSKPAIDLDIARPLLTTMHKMHRAGVDNYVTTEGRIRKLTPRECLRLMGFCDSFNIVVSDTQMYQQAGNSIVVDVLMAIVKKITHSYPDLAPNWNTELEPDLKAETEAAALIEQTVMSF